MAKKQKGIGNLYTGKMALKHREWRGFKDTMYDFGQWLVTWKDLIYFVLRAPVKITKGIFRYRWMASYLTTPAFIDRHTLGQRGTQLRITHMHFGTIIKASTDTIATTFKADAYLKGNKKLSDRIVLFDEMMMIHIIAGFPNLIGIPYQMIPVFECSVMDQQSMIPYLDTVESYGLPADTCPLPSCEAGCAIEDDYPKMGKCFIASTMPCDGSVMSTSFQDRRLKLPTYPLALPVRYDEPEVEECAVEDIENCIKFIEDQTGEKFNWDAFFEKMRRFNEETKYEMEKWEVNKTPYPQITGASMALYRMYTYQMNAGIDPYFLNVDKKVNKLMMKGYENKEKCSHELRHRAIIWSCPAHYYSNFATWAENCWGINVLVDMESLNAVRPFNLESEDAALKDLAHYYERMIMRKHTNGGHLNVLEELWRVCEEFNADFVIMYQHIACKTMAGLNGLFEEQAREHGIHLIWVEHDLMDPRTVSRREMRGKISKYMQAVMREEPIDPTLVDFEDEKAW
ncbi:MAG: 2-hydroxyacyl-CoA dehydratase family protein [Oscillospiraceae bacterium]